MQRVSSRKFSLRGGWVTSLANVTSPECQTEFSHFSLGKAEASVMDLSEYILEPLRKDGEFALYRGRHRNPDQSERPPILLMAPISPYSDIDDWKQAPEQLRNAEAELARMTRVMTLGQLAASIAHEVSQPLSGIITNANTCLRMLKSDPPNIDGARGAAQRMIRDGNRASEVITQLRTLFSKKEIDLEPLDLNEAIREVIAQMSGELQRNNVILKHESRDHLPAIKGDRIQLQQVILNLIRNGSDAMETVSDRPRQLLIQTETDDNQVIVSVQDSGVGFASEISERLFEPFFTTKQGGMGIGLSVCRSIVEAHHGRLWAVRNSGPGATFAFSIPQNTVNFPDEAE